ncbi:MAG: NAD(P)/FAD-dependent oxidoreductase [Pseudomonadota bacterium]
MPIERTDTVVVGGGQAGLAMSEHLSLCGVPHVVLERHRIAERWRSERWDSLVANGPAWHDRFPSFEFADFDPEGFPGKETVADYFVAYAEQIRAPIRCGVEVTAVRRQDLRRGFLVETSDGLIEADHVVAATGPFQVPVKPDLIPDNAGIHQLHSSAYKNPSQLPDGAVLVVGAGSSGAQIADDLRRAGRQVYLSVGLHDRPPRRYRGRDYVWWLGVLGKWDVQSVPGAEHVTIAVSGVDGGSTVDFRHLAAKGIALVGTTHRFADGVVGFAGDLASNIERGDANYLSVLDEADAYVERNGLDLPEDAQARVIDPAPPCMTDPLLELDLAAADVTTVLWATGFTVDFGWLEADVLDERGWPRHQRGVSPEPGIYFLGLPWQSRRASSFIWGVWHDARFVADHINTQRAYLAYGDSRP